MLQQEADPRMPGVLWLPLMPLHWSLRPPTQAAEKTGPYLPGRCSRGPAWACVLGSELLEAGFGEDASLRQSPSGIPL